MPPERIDSPDADSPQGLVLWLVAKLDVVVEQNKGLLARIDELQQHNKTLLARIAELEAKLGQPPKTPDNSSLPPSRGQKANAEPRSPKPLRKGRPGVARMLAEHPDATRRLYAERC